MKEDKYKNLLIFQNTRSVIIAERECKKNGFECIAVPTPRELSSQCGIALKITDNKREEILNFLRSQGKPFKVFDENNPDEFQKNTNCRL